MGTVLFLILGAAFLFACHCHEKQRIELDLLHRQGVFDSERRQAEKNGESFPYERPTE